MCSFRHILVCVCVTHAQNVHVCVSRVAESFEACKGLRGMRVRWSGGGGGMAPLQVGCEPLRVRVHSGDTGEDVSFEEVIYNSHLE